MSRATGQGQFATPMTIGLAHAYEVTGRLRAGLEEAEAAVEAGRLSGNRQILCWALTAEAWIAAIAGDLARARRRGRRGPRGCSRDLDDSVLSRGTRVHVAAALLEAGEPERCLEAMAERRPGVRAPGHAHVAGDAARSRELANEPTQAGLIRGYAWVELRVVGFEVDVGHESAGFRGPGPRCTARPAPCGG